MMDCVLDVRSRITAILAKKKKKIQNFFMTEFFYSRKVFFELVSLFRDQFMRTSISGL